MTTPSTPEPNESISDHELDEITGAGDTEQTGTVEPESLWPFATREGGRES